MEKRILIAHNYYQIPGGEDTVVENEKKMLEDHGHNVTLYSRHNAELQKMSVLKKMLLPVSTIFNIRTYKEVKKIIKEEKIDIVHVHNTLSLISPSIYYAALSCKVPVVQTVHNFRLMCPGATFYRKGRICEDCVGKGLMCAVRNNCYRKSKIQTLVCVAGTAFHRMIGTYKRINYICLTEFTKEKLLQLKFINSDRVFVKPNFTNDCGGKSESDGYYVFVGRVEEIKGIDILVDAFKLLPEKKLKIVGQGNLYENIEKRLSDERIDNIELLGFQDHKKVNEILRHADALIMCSQWYETFGMVILEAYSNGTPVIVGNIGNIKDLVVEGVTGEKFDYNSSASLAEAIRRFEANSSVEYGTNGYKFYLKNYSSEANYRRLIEIYDSL